MSIVALLIVKVVDIVKSLPTGDEVKVLKAEAFAP